jgi:hypothetical protein
MGELQQFVPVLAFVVQGGIAILGASLLLCGGRPLQIRWLAGLSYPIGATIVGLIQWATFGLGWSELAIPVIAVLAGVLLATAGVRRLKRHDVEARSGGKRSRFAAALIAFVALVGVVALVVTESSSLGESDPRWQWAYRAKIVATHASPDTPLLTDPEVLHFNRKYPLLFSSIEAVTLRLLGDTDGVASLRAVSLSFFLSYLLLIAAYALARQNAAAGLLALLVALAMPKLWSLGIDEAYVDFPLGVTALGLLFGLTELRRDWSGVIVPLVLGAAVGGLKSEGMILVAVIVIGTFTCRPYRSNLSETLRNLLPLVGAAITLIPHAAYLSHVKSRSVYGNVQFSDIGPISFSHFMNSYSTIIYRFLCEGLLNASAIGLFVPLVLISAILVRSHQARLPVGIAMTYIAVMSVPFLFTKLPLERHLHVAVLRIFFQLIPILTLTIFEGISMAVHMEYGGSSPPSTMKRQ